MSFITVTDSEMMEEIEEGCGDWEVVEEGEWTQDHKYQHKESVVKHLPTGKFYSYGIGRSGSPFTDWYYSYDDGDFPELMEVEKKERVITESYWSVV